MGISPLKTLSSDLKCDLLERRAIGSNPATLVDYDKVDYPPSGDIIYGTSLAGGVIAPGYDKARRLIRFEDEMGISTMTFDAVGRLQESTQASVNHEIVREYDA